MTEKLNDTQISRRKFLKATTLTLTGGAVALGGVSVMAFKKDKLQLRPPGALDEELFLASVLNVVSVCRSALHRLSSLPESVMALVLAFPILFQERVPVFYAAAYPVF